MRMGHLTDAALPQNAADGFPSRFGGAGLSLFASWHGWKKQGRIFVRMVKSVE